MDTAEIDLKEIVAIIKRQGRLIIATLAFSIGLALIYILSTTPIYRATTLLMVDSRGTNLLDPKGSDPQQSAILNALIDSEAEILRSQATALAVIQAGNLVADSELGPQISWLEKATIALGIEGNNLRRMVGLTPKAEPSQESLVQGTITRLQNSVAIRRQGLTYLLSITGSSKDPIKAATIANLYAQTYIQQNILSKSSSLLASRAVLSSQLLEAQQQLIQSEGAVDAYIQDNLARLESESNDPRLADLRRQLESIKQDGQRLESNLISLETALVDGNLSQHLDQLGNVALRELDSQRRSLQNRLQGLQAGSQEAVDLAAALSQLESNIQTQGSAILRTMRNEANTSSELEASVLTQIRESLMKSGLSAETMTTLFNLQQTASNALSKYQTLLTREQDLATMANLQVADARVVSQALPPSIPSEPRKQIILLASIFGGLFIGLILGFLREYYIGGISSANQLENVINAKVPVAIGEIEQKEGVELSDAIITAPMSPYTESFRKLRISIDMASDPQNFQRGRVILITSALQAEGKSTSAISLARTYAAAGLRVLLIDSDLRKPTLATRLGLDPEPGLIDYLTNFGKENSRDLQIMQDPKSSLMVVPAGRRSSMPTDQLINSQAYRALITETCNHFDVVVIDSPPLLPVVDTRYLARFADAIVQIVRFSTTSQNEAREASNQLVEMKHPDVPLFGVLSHEKRFGPIYGRYYNYSYYGEDNS